MSRPSFRRVRSSTSFLRKQKSARGHIRGVAFKRRRKIYMEAGGGGEDEGNIRGRGDDGRRMNVK